MSQKPPKLKITELKKQLNRLSQPELVKLLVETYKQNEPVQTFITSRLADTPVQEKQQPVKQNESADLISLKVWKKWLKLPLNVRNRIIANVWCGRCSNVVSIRDFSVLNDKSGVVLEGSCSACGHPVARVVEDV
ncbi:MAG: hypothetical protein K0S39_3104 [Paenibacillus sp.]|jgi:hypothetical protein|nr:hypothetical protein [Paenibacillus sp.]